MTCGSIIQPQAYRLKHTDRVACIVDRHSIGDQVVGDQVVWMIRILTHGVGWDSSVAFEFFREIVKENVLVRIESDCVCVAILSTHKLKSAE